VIEPGLTGVVGPNGCGKSTWSRRCDGRWAGTSHKSLAADMDAVIFAGSGNRPSRKPRRSGDDESTMPIAPRRRR